MLEQYKKTVESVMRTHYIPEKTSFGMTIRKAVRKYEYIAIPLPNKTMDTEELLRVFHRKNPIGQPLGYKIYRQKFPDNSYYAIAYYGQFVIFIEQDRDTNEHFVYLKYKSHFDDQWYLIASGKKTINCDNFFNHVAITKQLHTLVITRQFRTAAINCETSIPTE